MMSAANNSPNEVLGNERNQMISQKPSPDWPLSCQPPGIEFKFPYKLTTHPRVKLSTTDTGAINRTLNIITPVHFAKWRER